MHPVTSTTRRAENQVNESMSDLTLYILVARIQSPKKKNQFQTFNQPYEQESMELGKFKDQI